VPPGILHAPGSLLTYEPQRASDVAVFFQSMVEGRFNTRSTLEKDIPKDRIYDFDYLLDILDWDKNVDPDFKANRHLIPVPVKATSEQEEEGYRENWIVYGCSDFCAKELTVLPGRTALIKDVDAYGFIVVQGHGTINGNLIESPSMIKFGQLTQDEMFVSRDAAIEGVVISNPSAYGELVMLKHFGPGNSEAACLVKSV
jgi:hypothetical protein